MEEPEEDEWDEVERWEEDEWVEVEWWEEGGGSCSGDAVGDEVLRREEAMRRAMAVARGRAAGWARRGDAAAAVARRHATARARRRDAAVVGDLTSPSGCSLGAFLPHSSQQCRPQQDGSQLSLVMA